MARNKAARSKVASPAQFAAGPRRVPVIILLLTLVFSAVIYVAGFKIMDRDFWAHVKIGELVVSQHSLPLIEPFAYTRPGQPFRATHEWLAQAALFTVLRWFGFTGMIVLRTLLAGITIACVLLAGRRRLWSAAIVAGLVLNGLRPGLMDRPQLFSYAIFSAMLCLGLEWLARPEEQTRLRIPVFMLVLHVLWVNLHGAAALLSFLVVGAMLADVLWNSRPLRASEGRRSADIKTWRQDAIPALRLLAVLSAALAIGLFVSPSGYHTLTYLHDLLTDKTIAFIGEWQPRKFEMYVRALGPLWVITLIALLAARRQIVFSLVTIGVTAYASRLAFRHEMLFAVAAGVISARQWSISPALRQLTGWVESTPRRSLLFGLAAFLSLAVYTAKEQYRFLLKDNLFGYGAFDLARGAYEFVEREHIAGNMFNTYGIGGYLIYRGFPHRKVFIDGRNVDYGFDFMMQAYLAGSDPAVWQRLEQRYRLTYALIDYDAIMDASRIPYSDHLDANPNWALVYLDDWVAVYLKRIPENQPAIEKYSYAQLRPSHLRGLSGLNPSRGQLEALKQELARSIAASPASIKARVALARICLDSGDVEHAMQLMHDAQAVQPHRAAVFEVLAAGELHRGDYKAAARAYDQMLRCVGDAYPNLNYKAVASVYRKAGRVWRARLIHPFGKWEEPPAREAGINILPSHLQRLPSPGTPDVAGVGGLLEHLGQASEKAHQLNDEGVDMAHAGRISEAIHKFLAALALLPQFPEALNNAGACYDKIGEVEKAEEFYRRALEQQPNYGDARRNLAYLLYRRNNFDEALGQAREAEKLGINMEAFLAAIGTPQLPARSAAD